MKTPICEFVQQYKESNMKRLHMPGHKGLAYLGMESYDITEIDGADSLYEASGIIKESEENAAVLFGTAATFYSTEGSSQCIRAMLYLAQLHAKRNGKAQKIIAGRNAHKTFITAAALLDLDVQWLPIRQDTSYLSCAVDYEVLENYLKEEPAAAVYLTSPDYLGNTVDIEKVSALCKKHDTLLLIDNAHGAYLKFLETSRHPVDLGADLCCDSAHKTLPCLTGGAYLHISKDKFFVENGKNALALFGSTSPSYLIMQSLDRVNAYLADGYSEKLQSFVKMAEGVRGELEAAGFEMIGDEPMKYTFATKSYGYKGTEFAEELLKRNVVCEFADPDFLVLMLSVEMGSEGLNELKEILCDIKKKDPVMEKPLTPHILEKRMSIRDAIFSEQEKVPVRESEGRILAALNIGCPPAVPIVVCGEEIDAHSIRVLEYYGISECDVVKKRG